MILPLARPRTIAPKTRLSAKTKHLIRNPRNNRDRFSFYIFCRCPVEKRGSLFYICASLNLE